MRLRKFYVISLICFIVVLNCANKIAFCENVQQNNIKDGAVVLFSEYQFVIKFSNLIFEKNGKEMKIPIFRGNMGDVYYKSFHEYCYKNNLLEKGWGESNFIIKADKGKLTKTFREFLNFYKGNILKNVDINKPNKIKIDGGALDIFYDFEINGIPFALQVGISTDKKEIAETDSIKSIFDVNLDENMATPIFTYRFWKNKTSNDL